MSTAHRPTWDPAQAKEVKSGSRQFSARDIASHTKLKFRQSGQSSSSEVSRRDLRAELLVAEAEAREKKRKAEGRPLDAPSSKAIEGSSKGKGKEVDNEGSDEETNKRRKLLQEAIALDKDDDDSEEDKDDDEDDSDEDDEEDDTAELLRELEKIKRERAEEKARQEQEQNAKSQRDREEEIALGNPLLNLAAALGQSTPGGASVASTTGGFTVKKRWDDDVIFKNQAMGSNDRSSGQFVNDLLRTEFHKKFMAKFIK
ncbi:hypothetical protein M407DRAFT_245299 [Tulasnella calospora MUT 4182]|uniref:Cwf15/Cwc15 cell cycle control protein n=1 Tax=Tulasnella calospora MUT 4182 TaxID=1051891 RepID=A0A0C3KKU2_9AGAM|nr:hypothetical protein M407DRAFT_245299 [Tulasnella calospora MUT 4182]